MNLKTLAAVALATLALTACDDTTDNIGTSLTDNMDHLEVATSTFTVTTRSIIADSVLSRNSIGYLGKIRDPETGAYITADFMAQFHTLDNYGFPQKDSIVSLLNGEVVADSAELRLFYTTLYGDSLAPMKLTAYEMRKPMEEGVNYYSNFDPIKEGYVNTNGYKEEKVYTLADLNVSESERYSSSYMRNIRIPLNTPYTDADGNTYNNYGTYVMQKYYANLGTDGTAPSFSNSYRFIHDVVPGFYFQSTGGLGAMPYISISQLNVYFRYHTLNTSNRDTIYVGTASFAGTEEVLQTNTIVNDRSAIQRLVNDNTCTYLKTPAGIFTEMTLPVEEIMRGHDNDTINTAKVVLTRLNDEVESDYTLDIPQTLLMIPKDSLYTFFEQGKIVDNRTSFYATYNPTSTYPKEGMNRYIFSNISGMISYMNKVKASGKASEDWNKVVIIPVNISTSTVNYSTYITKVVHDMSLTSTRLVGGSENPYDPIQISVIYSKFE